MTAKWVHFSMNAPLEGHSTYSHFAYFCFQHNCNLHIAVLPGLLLTSLCFFSTDRDLEIFRVII